MVQFRAAPDIPNVVSGTMPGQRAIARVITKRLTVRLSPGALAALDRGELDERLRRYRVKEMEYHPNKIIRSVTLTETQHTKLAEGAAASGLTINKFLERILVDGRIRPLGPVKSVAPAVPDPEPVKINPVIAAGMGIAPLPSKSQIIRTPAVDKYCSMVTSTDPDKAVRGFFWAKDTKIPSVPTVDDVDNNFSYCVGKLAWQQVATPSLPFGGPLLVNKTDQLMVNIDGTPHGWIPFPRPILKYLVEKNVQEMHVTENLRFTVNCWPNHTYDVSDAGTW